MDALRQLSKDLNDILVENRLLKAENRELHKRPTIARFNALQEEKDGLLIALNEYKVRSKNDPLATQETWNTPKV